MSLQLTRHLRIHTYQTHVGADIIRPKRSHPMKAFLKRKNIIFSARRYGIDALGAMAQGLFCSLLIGTIGNYVNILWA